MEQTVRHVPGIDGTAHDIGLRVAVWKTDRDLEGYGAFSGRVVYQKFETVRLDDGFERQASAMLCGIEQVANAVAV